MGERVADQKLFDEVYRRQLHNPSAFWTPYPFPSIAADDPAFVRPIPRNSWGGASQALTALRALRWIGALRQVRRLHAHDDTREFSPDCGAYSPAMLTLFDFVWRLYSVRPCGIAVCRKIPRQPPLSGAWLSCAPMHGLDTDARRKTDRPATRNRANRDHNRR
jgi:hypothetical protein